MTWIAFNESLENSSLKRILTRFIQYILNEADSFRGEQALSR